MTKLRSVLVAAVAASALIGCGSSSPLSSFGGSGAGNSPQTAATVQSSRVRGGETVAVNRYIWAAALDVLDFMPITSIDPFTGVIVMGYGTPPGTSRAYRATVLVSDPALDARSLTLAMATRSGPVSAETLRTVENAILTRARQLRIADSRL